jgi:hypothetical protein
MTSEGPPRDASETEFGPEMAHLAVLVAARKKARVAVDKSLKLPIAKADSKYFLVWTYPPAPHPLMTFLLTRDYDEMVEGRGETFRVSVPIVKIDFRNPVPATDEPSEYFMAARVGTAEQGIVGAANFAEFLAQLNETPAEFSHKIDTYKVVPIGQFVHPLDD